MSLIVKLLHLHDFYTLNMSDYLLFYSYKRTCVGVKRQFSVETTQVVGGGLPIRSTFGKGQGRNHNANIYGYKTMFLFLPKLF